MIQAIEVQVISKILMCPPDEHATIDILLGYSPDLYFVSYKNEIEFIHEQHLKHNIIPSRFSFQAEFPEFNLVDVPEPVEYLVEKLKEYRRYLLLNETFNKVKELGDGDVDIAWHYLSSQCDKADMLDASTPMDIVKDAEERARQIQEFSRQERIPTGFPEIDKLMYGGLSTVEELLVIIARTNSGKAQPLWSKVLTLKGWTKMGDLKVGDTVVGMDNDNGKVIKIFPQGIKDYYNVYFDDGTRVSCCDDHLWIANNSVEDRVFTLKEIREDLEHTYSIPLCGNLIYKDKVCELPFDSSISSIAEFARSCGMWVKVDYSNGTIQIDSSKTHKVIDRIEYAGQTTCQCILLDNHSHSYITDYFTVTHNTWLCTKMMESSQKNGFPVAYYSPEMQAAFLGTRFDTWREHFENSQLFRGNYSAEYYNYIRNLKGEETSAYVIEDKDFPDGVSVRTLDPFIKKHGIKLLIIDGISYMQDDERATRDQEKYKNIALGLFRISKKYGCAVVLVMQANREVRSKDDKGESIPTLYNAEGSDQPARIATQAFGVRQIFDKHVLDIALLKSRMANNSNPVLSYAWDINTGQAQYIPGDGEDGDPSTIVSTSPTLTTGPTISFGAGTQPDSNDLSLLDDDDDDELVEF